LAFSGVAPIEKRMALDQDTIKAQLDLLAAHRRTLAVYLRQQAERGVLAPPGVVNGIAETQSAIRRIKDQLRADGVPVEDQPNDLRAGKHTGAPCWYGAGDLRASYDMIYVPSFPNRQKCIET